MDQSIRAVGRISLYKRARDSIAAAWVSGWTLGWRPMTIQEWGAIGEVIGGLAVVLTLAYLAVQIRQNTRTLRTSSHQTVLDSFRELNRILNEQPELARIYRRGLNEPGSLSKEERFQFDTFLVAQVFHFFNVLKLHESKVIDQATFERFRAFLLMLLQTPGGAAHWRETQAFHVPALVNHLNQQLTSSETLPPPISDGVASFGID